jgi:predicted RNase H-like nuclease (RuvC/YqgF family)
MELEKTTAVSALEAQLQSSQDSLDESKALSETQISELKTEIERLTALSSSEDERVQSLKDEYDELDAKYKKLLRPARSSVGKHVVSVWFSQSGGRDVYRIRETEEGEFKLTTRAQMSAQLAKLKDEYGKSLYVKVIIPENSGLSYSDAWRFTTEMQRAYDYYYQDDE